MTISLAEEVDAKPNDPDTIKLVAITIDLIFFILSITILHISVGYWSFCSYLERPPKSTAF